MSSRTRFKHAICLFAFLTVSCAKPRSAPFTASEVQPHFSFTSTGNAIVCNATLTYTHNQTTTALVLSAEDLITCDRQKMIDLGAGQYGLSLPYEVNKTYVMSLFRAEDGSTLSQSFTP